MPPPSVTFSPTTPADHGLVCRLEAHAVRAWPAAVSQRVDGGWILRATPGLDRARSNHALTPCRAVGVSEVPRAIARVESFARRHGIPAGIQVSPLSLQGTLMSELDRRGWATRWPVLVLAAPVRAAGVPPDGLALEVADRATPEWLAAWARCEPSRDVEAHARTVFPLIAGRARFGRLRRARAAGGCGSGCRVPPGRGVQRAGGVDVRAARIHRGVSLLPPDPPQGAEVTVDHLGV